MKQNKVSYSKGITWIDDCRIPFVDESDIKTATPFGDMTGVKIYGRNSFNESKTEFDTKLNTQGRFPANILVSDDMLNDGVISKSVRGGIGKPIPRQDTLAKETITERGGFNDKGTNSRYYDIDKWFDKILND